jgi:UDP-N-acetylglucosamine:LPS N-acetylglucosamine transferase
VRAANFPNLHFKLREMIDRPALLAAMAKNAKKIAKPDAGRRILEDVLRQL